ncbi:YggS family pyridoxal phosphate-dependent enzyme [Actinomyces vulturis]|uniref:YggS family pyridoxal phosphate-dependent enzyme n=1 Tax=Actinomyces vulturis TaxID=1857645 RepID=UPI00159EDEF6|nr:YggS family pyridoxal phosphate-dependent enzyme [Actinomyces vulturis]
MMNSNISDRVSALLDRVEEATASAGRPEGSVDVLAAVKTQNDADIAQVIRVMSALRPERIVNLGHNRVNELVAGGPALCASDLPAHRMHLIGPLQRNKVSKMLRWASALDSLDSLRLAHKVNDGIERANTESLTDDTAQVLMIGAHTKLDVLIQVNVSGEETKSGFLPSATLDAACEIAALPHLRLRGLMTVGLNSNDELAVRTGYAQLRELVTEIRQTSHEGTEQCTELSMGMTHDVEWAIAEGSTQVRVGQALFGPRPATV